MNVVPHGGRKALGRRSTERRGARKNFFRRRATEPPGKFPGEEGKNVQEGAKGSDGAKGRAGKGVDLVRGLGQSRSDERCIEKRTAELTMRAAVFRGGGGRAEAGCGSAVRGSPGRVRRETPNAEARLPKWGARRVWSGGEREQAPGGRRARLARKRVRAKKASAGEMKPDEEVLRQRSCRQAEGRVGKAVSAKLRSAGAGETWKPVQRFGDVRSDMRRLIFLQRSGCVANGFPGTRLRAQRLGSVVLRRAESDFGQRNSAETFFFASRKKFPCK